VTVPNTEAQEAGVANKRANRRGQPNCQLVNDIKE
jgi:hypothetical protein